MSLENFHQLCNSIREKAARDIKQKRPESQLTKWQKLFTTIVETELAIHRVRKALNLLKTTPSKKTLDTLSMSEGAWIDYHYVTWAFLAFALLERERSLIKQVVRSLVKPSKPQYKAIEKTLLNYIEAQRIKMSKMRHPLAHAGEGGTVEAVISTDLWKNFAIIPSPLDFNKLLASYVPYHMRWHYFLHGISEKIIAELERTSKELYQQIDWDNI